MKKIVELKNKLVTLKEEAQAFLDAGNVEESKNKIQAIKGVQEEIQAQEMLDSIEITDLQDKAKDDVAKVNAKESANVVRAMIKKVTGRKVTEAENALLLPTGADENGTSYILPQDISSKIHKVIRQYRSLRDVVGYLPAGALSGSFPMEDFETVSELIDFTDGTDGQEANDIKFKNVPYALKEKGALIKLSNTLLQMSDNALIDYVVYVFARKAVITENKMIIDKLKAGKTVKTLKTWDDLRKSLNVDIDPAMLFDTVIVTNQDGFDFLDAQTDKNGKPLMQADITSATGYRFKGFPVACYSNVLLPTVGNKAPVYYGNLNEGVKVVDYKGLINFATSSEAGFNSNTTIARLIEFIDVIQVDKSDKCYIVGELELEVII